MASERPDIIALALAEDIGPGDVTARHFTRPGATATARLIARQDCILAGTATAAEVFRRVGPTLEIEIHHADGTRLEKGTAALTVNGPAAPILTAERTALNFIQRLSGVATLARRFTDAIAGTGAKILDTRKTTPGLRLLEKAAAASGGATNHRLGLHDMVMVKDNHLATGLDPAALQEMVDRFREAHPSIRIEIEADTPAQAEKFFSLRGIDAVLLDNMSLAELREAVRLRPPGISLEASGGVTLETVRAIAETGVDYISVGAITHSAPAIDFALDFIPAPQKTPLPLNNSADT
jgi:nicotinate-nucleotide pyrophosphorylase (carboxylating)